jgi:micrococcal nuclease
MGILMYEYRAKLIKVIDGDTLDLLVDLGFHTSIKIRGRLIGVNTPERNHPDWAKATAKLTELLARCGETIIIKTQKDKTEKYGRWLVYIDGVNDELWPNWPWKNK